MSLVGLPLPAVAVALSKKDARLGRHVLSFVKLFWLSQMTFLSFMCHNIASMRICSMVFPGTEKGLSGLWLRGSSFLHF